MAVEPSSMGALSDCGSMRRAGRDIALQWHNPAFGEAPRAVGVNALARQAFDLGENGSIFPRRKGKRNNRDRSRFWLAL